MLGTCTVDFYYNLPYNRLIAQDAARRAILWGGDRVNIRALLHNHIPPTFTDADEYRRTLHREDPNGDHYTAEYRNRRTLKWRTFHVYFKKDSVGYLVFNESVSPNPRVWTNKNSGRTMLAQGVFDRTFEKVWS